MNFLAVAFLKITAISETKALREIGGLVDRVFS
jgi:hypothetical protein